MRRTLLVASSIAALVLLSARTSRADEPVAPMGIHFTLALGLSNGGSPSWGSGAATNYFDATWLVLDGGIEGRAFRATAEFGATFYGFQFGIRGDWLASETGWTPVLGGFIETDQSGLDIFTTTETAYLLEGGIAWRNSEGHTRFLLTARAGLASIYDNRDDVAETSVRPSFGAVVQVALF